MAEPAKSNAARIAKRRDECAAHHARLEENWAKKLAAGKDASPIAPAWISHCINKVRTKDAIIVKESPLQTQYLDVDRPCMVLNPGAASGLGHGMGVALGLKLANRDTLVIGTEGDGAYMYNVPVSAHYVSAEQQLPVLWVVFNNQRWQAVRNATAGSIPTATRRRVPNSRSRFSTASPIIKKPSKSPTATAKKLPIPTISRRPWSAVLRR